MLPYCHNNCGKWQEQNTFAISVAISISIFDLCMLQELWQMALHKRGIPNKKRANLQYGVVPAQVSVDHAFHASPAAVYAAYRPTISHAPGSSPRYPPRPPRIAGWRVGRCRPTPDVGNATPNTAGRGSGTRLVRVRTGVPRNERERMRLSVSSVVPATHQIIMRFPHACIPVAPIRVRAVLDKRL